MSAFDAIRLAMTGLSAHQKALNVTGHNVANVSTPGYHRQEAILTANTPQKSITGEMTVTAFSAGGVDVQEVRRIQDSYLQQQFNSVMGQFGRSNTMAEYLQRLETVLAPGSTLNLSTMLDRFFSAWQQLATYPEEKGTRTLVVGEAVNLTAMMNTQANDLTAMQANIDSAVSTRVDRVNLLADELAGLNAQIGEVLGQGIQPNDLLDKRDVIYNELAALVGTSSLSTGDAAPVINLNGRPLVQGSVANHLEYQTTVMGLQITWEDGAQAQITSGEIAGLIQVRDTAIPDYLSQLNAIALALSSSVNGLHTTGKTMSGAPAGNFFSGATAGSIAVDPSLVADASGVTASTLAGAIGDGALALAISQLRNQPLIGNQTVQAAAASMISGVGYAVKSAQTTSTAASAMKEQLTNQVLATSGVNMDEEMTNLILFQRAYDASARVLSVADEMIRTVIERLGV